MATCGPSVGTLRQPQSGSLPPLQSQPAGALERYGDGMKMHGSLLARSSQSSICTERAWQAVGRAAPTARQGLIVRAQDGADLIVREVERDQRGRGMPSGHRAHLSPCERCQP
eukprot:scaffold15379_cov133-Isochrysis_galbana.AAC.8